MNEKETRPRSGATGGVILIIIGLVALAAQFINTEWIGLAVLPTLGLIFLAWGLLTRQSGLLIPGGILSGLGLGVILTATNLESFEGVDAGGVFFLSFALGWFLITLLSTLFTPEKHLWALIPGGIMAVLGFGLLYGGAFLEVLEFLGRIWPVFLIALGAYILFKVFRQPEEREPVEKYEG